MMRGPDETKRGAARVQLMAILILFLLAHVTLSASLGPEDLFELAGIGPEEVAKFSNGQPWQATGNDTLRRMLYRIERDVRPADLESWSLGEVDLEYLVGDPGAYRLQVFELRGRVVLAEPYRLSERQDDAGEFASIWRCRMLLDSDERAIDVFTARVPKAWKVGEPIDEPAGALAFFLKTSKLDGAGPAAFFLADRMAWYPPTHLGGLGMDVALLDDVLVEAPPKLNSDGSMPEINWTARQLTESDHESFYQMLKAVGSAEEGQLRSWAEQDLAKEGKSSFSIVPPVQSASDPAGTTCGTDRRRATDHSHPCG